MPSLTLYFYKDSSIKKDHCAHKDIALMAGALRIPARTTVQTLFGENPQTVAPDRQRHVHAACGMDHNSLRDGKDHGSIQGLAVAPSSEGP